MKQFLNPILASLILILGIGLRISDPSFVESVRLRYYDSLINSLPIVTSENVVIVNIDEDAIEQYGQWPFPRNAVSDIIENLYQHGAGLVVWNTIMSEEDRFGYDQTLSNTLKQYPVILSNAPLDKKQPKLASHLIERIQLPDTSPKCSKDYAGVSVIGEGISNWAVSYPSILFNIPLLEDCAVGSGITNTFPEIDGITRRLPMIISSNGFLYPNLALETLRVVAGDSSFQVKVNESGIQAVRIPQFNTITTDSIGRIWLNWNSVAPEFSVTNIPTLDNKIVIVGLTAIGLNNPVATSAGAKYPHHLQGSVIDTLISGNNISIPDWAFIAELGFTVLLSIISLLLARWKYGFIPVLSFVTSIYYATEYIFNQYHLLFDGTFPIVAILGVYIVVYTVKFLSELNAKLQIKKQFGTYLSPALVEKLQKNPELLRLGGERRQLSIMFTDVRGFTTISEHFGDDVEGLTSIMNRYMTKMTSAIIENNGTLDKYIGDAQMAFWNAPLDEVDHAKQSVKTALQMLGSLDEFNKEISAENIPPFGMGLGINTADVTVGNMGSSQRFDYTCLGDGVNLASRLEGQSKPYGVKIVIGELTAKQIEDEYFTLELDMIKVKGKTQGVKIYTVLCTLEDSLEYKLAKHKHESMLELYRQQQWIPASILCNELMGEFNGAMDSYYRMLIERIADYRESNLSEDWDGIYISLTK